MGEKQNRARARLKFLVAKLGIDEFRRLVLEELLVMGEDGSKVEELDPIEEAPPPTVGEPECSSAASPSPEEHGPTLGDVQHALLKGSRLHRSSISMARM